MTSNAPVVKIGKEHSQRDVGNQRCFLSNSLLDLGITTPAAHGKGSSQKQREREKESGRDRDNKESWKKKSEKDWIFNPLREVMLLGSSCGE